MGLFDVFGNKSNELCKAARNGAILLVKKLLEEGVDVNKRGDDGRDNYKKKETPLHYAISNGDLDIICLLLDYGADLEAGSPLYMASGEGNLEIAKLLLERGAFVDGVYDTYDGSGKNAEKFLNTPLSIASSVGCKDVVKLLLEHKADVSGLKSNILDTPLANALLYSDTPESSSKLLLNYNAPVNLHLCAGLGDLSMMQGFFDKSISPSGMEYSSFGHGYTPLYFAINCNKLDAVQLLLDSGVNPNEEISSVDLDENALQLLIFKHANIKMLKLLIKKGADIHKEVSYGKTLIEFAKMHNRDNVAEILENA